jgi:hypothetical protein
VEKQMDMDSRPLYTPLRVLLPAFVAAPWRFSSRPRAHTQPFRFAVDAHLALTGIREIWGCRSRALGESSRLALHQGLQYYDVIDKTYKVGKFFSIRDQAMRMELSQLKEQYPELPVDAGNLYRAF